MSSNNLPPVRHLPQWSRVGRLGVPCSPRRLPSHRLQPLPVLPAAEREGPRATTGAVHVDPDARVASLQRNIEFLQYQHKETLHKLHKEVDFLRRENKELKYKMIMEAPKPSRKVLKHSQVGVGPVVRGRESTQNQMLRSMGDCLEIHGPYRANRRSEQLVGPGISLQPLQVHNGLSRPPRASTLRECEIIIRQLYNTNSLQSQEIVRYKELLRDIVLNKRITPENYNLTKAYLVDDICKSSDMFPKLDLQSGKTTGVTLPALTQSLSSSVAERQRRSRAVHRGHVKATVR